MFVIISHKNKQYKVEPNKTYKFDLMDLDTKEKKISFSEVLLFSNDKKVFVGMPIVKNCSVEAEIVGEVSEPKVSVLKFHSKKRYKRTATNRAKKTLVKILKIDHKNEK